MPTTTKQTAVPLWHYQCPDCGIGDGETGYQAHTHVLYCELCMEDDRHVRLRRWPADTAAGPNEAGRPGSKTRGGDPVW